MSLSFLALVLVLSALSAALAWFALGKVDAPLPLDRGDRRGWDVLAVQHHLQGDLSGEPASWALQGEIDGRPVRLRVVEVEGRRYTEARVEVPALAGLSARSRARGERVRHAVPAGHPDLDEALLFEGEVGSLAAVLADPARRASWRALLGPDDGPVLLDGWLVRSIDGCVGDEVEALLQGLLEGARRL